MGPMASQIVSLAIAYSTVCSGADLRQHQSSVSLAFVRGIHRWPVNSPHKGPVTRKCFHLMTSSCQSRPQNFDTWPTCQAVWIVLDRRRKSWRQSRIPLYSSGLTDWCRTKMALWSQTISDVNGEYGHGGHYCGCYQGNKDHLNSFGYRAPVDEIYGYTIFKCIAVIWQGWMCTRMIFQAMLIRVIFPEKQARTIQLAQRQHDCFLFGEKPSSSCCRSLNAFQCSFH